MIEQTYQIHLFYPLRLLALFAILVTICFIVNKLKDTSLFKNIFNKHSDEHIEVHKDTTEKMKDMHDNVVKLEYGEPQEKELHRLEVLVLELKHDVDLLTTRVMFLEKHKKIS